jgi:hypothetical protein
MSLILCFVLLSLTCAALITADEFIVFPEVYESRVEINFNHLNLTVGVEEWEDQTNGLYRLRNKRRFAFHEYYFDYKGGEMHSVIGEKCLTEQLTATSHTHVLGMSVLNYTEGFPISAVGTLKSFSKFVKTTNYSTTVRGVLADCVEGVGKFNEFNVSITGEFCLSSNTWDEMGLFIALPLSVVLRSKDITAPLHIEIHFHQFLGGFTETKNPFQTAENVFCQGRKFSPIPQVPNYLSYHQESFTDNPAVEYITNGQVMYDKLLNLLRYDYRNGISQPPFYSTGSLSVIHDFNSGVAYYQDLTLGNCTAQPIGADIFDIKGQSIQNISQIPSVSLRSPNDLLHFTTNFTFVGEKTLRGIPTNYYIGLQVFAFPWIGRNELNATFGVHFLKTGIESMPVGRGAQIQADIPLQLVIKAYNKPGVFDDMLDYTETYNFFNFDMANTSDGMRHLNEAPPWAYDIHHCYSNLEEKHIRFTFEGAKHNEIPTSEIVFLPTLSMESLRRAVNGRFSSIRLQQPEVDYNETHIFLTVTLLPRPKPEYQFIRVQSRSFKTLMGDVFEQNTIEECQAACSNKQLPPCQAFSYCSTTKSCMYSTKTVVMEDLTDSNDCEVGTRSVVSSGPELPVDHIIDSLREAVLRKSMQLKLSNTTLVATELQENVNRGGKGEDDKGRQFPIVGRHLEQFTQIRNKQIQPTRTFITPMLADECAQQCLNDGSAKECIAFTYFYKTGICTLTSWDPEIDKDKITINSEAISFKRNFLARFTAVEGEKKHVLKLGFLVDGGDACAKKCIENQKDPKDPKACRSFDLCSIKGQEQQKGQKFCFLSESHKSEKEGGQLEVLTCTHYSRSFEVDFIKRYQHDSMSLEGYKTEYGVSPSQCASMCVEKEGAQCKGYYFCPGQGKESGCGVVLTSMTELEHKSGIFTCAYYERAFLPDGTPYVVTNLGGETGVSTGLTVFLVILFFVLGGFITFLAVHFIQKAIGKRVAIEDIRLYFNTRENTGTA